MRKIVKISLPVMKWMDEDICPKCGWRDQPDQDAGTAIETEYINSVDLLELSCQNCGYAWLMECRDK